jgi:hypothetical protein
VRAALGLALLIAAGCRREAPPVTSLRIVATWSDVEVKQLEFSVTGPDGTRLVTRQRRPSQPQTLTSGADVVIYFPDSLGGQQIHAEIAGLSGDQVVGTAPLDVRLRARLMVEMTVRLTAGPGAKIDGAPCADGKECQSDVCADGVCCATECTGTCRSCAVPGKQGTCALVPEGVKHSGCAIQPPEMCGFDGTCDGLGECRHHPLGTQCATGTCTGSNLTAEGACDGKGTCVMGTVQTCAPYNCDPTGKAPHCFASCTSGAQCVPGRECLGGSCGQKLPGATCGGDAECVSGFCTDGVCCESRCAGACLSCAQVGAVGSCRPVASGVKDPRGLCVDQEARSCGTSGSCDGAGGCARYAAGTVCQAPTCMSDGVEMSAGRCNGGGNCVAGGAVPCAPFRCSGMTGACATTCTHAGDCAPGITCMLDQHSCGKRGPGQACETAGDCLSNYCVDKVCCQEACQGACRSCALGPQPGMCTLATSGAVDPRDTCKDQGRPSCGTDGTCTAAGTCHTYPAGTPCGPGSCNAATNTRTLPGSCSNNGACASGAQVLCGAYRCNGSACFAACSSDADCVPPSTCVGGACMQHGVGTPCTKPSDCTPPFTCVGTSCQLKQVGTTCESNTDCSTGHCTDGVCCELASCGACRRCSLLGFIGFCHEVSAGTTDRACEATPASGCGHDGTCDGTGNCRLYPAGTPCAGLRCSGHLRTNAGMCDGKGMCKDSGTHDCTPFTCNPATNDCFGACQNDMQCCCGTHCGNNTCSGN